MFQEKFGDETASKYLENTASKNVDLILKYFLENESMSYSLAEEDTPNQDSPFHKKLLYDVRKISEHFRSGLCQKVDPALKLRQVIERAPSSLPSLSIAGKIQILKSIRFLKQCTCCA